MTIRLYPMSKCLEWLHLARMMATIEANLGKMNDKNHLLSSKNQGEAMGESTEEKKCQLSKQKRGEAVLARAGLQARRIFHFSHGNKGPGASTSPSSLNESFSFDTNENVSALLALNCFSSGRDMKTDTAARRWLSSFRQLDPRWQISRFFTDLEQEGARDIEASGELVASPTSPILLPFVKSSVFTVWRPTSFVAIKRMIAGEATGKGLEIKGKSAKTGKLSGFVPYLQIHQEEDKKRTLTLPREGRTRVFFASKQARDQMATELEPLQNQMVNAAMKAKLLLRDISVTGLTPFSAATRMAARPIGKKLSSASKSIGHTVSVASDTAVSSVKPIEKMLSKASSAVKGGWNATLSGTNSLQQSKSTKSNNESITSIETARETLPRTSLTGQTRENSGVDNDEEEKVDDEEREWALTRILFDMDDPSIKIIDKYAPECYGIELPDRMLWAACVADRDISRPEGSEYYTGRVSEPAFQDMNFKAIWKTQKKKRGPKSDLPRVVLWQTCTGESDSDDVMDARGMIMAYEENGRVLPVVSDFDCFTVGTRGVKYDSQLPSEQADLVSWEISQISSILDKEKERERHPTWTSCWLNQVLKPSASKGFMPSVPRYGYGDPKSYAIMECAVARLSKCGAVRHGAECFNYFFPQELDDEFLIVSDTLPGNVSWRYVNVSELQEFLGDKIDEGFTFPLNPKWVLCDEGWKNLYDRLLSSDKPNVRDSMNIWFPPQLGIRERIESIHEQHPRGFVQEKQASRLSGTEAMDLAALELDRFLALQRAKIKLRAVIAFNDLLVSVRRRNGEDLKDADTGRVGRAVDDRSVGNEHLDS